MKSIRHITVILLFSIASSLFAFDKSKMEHHIIVGYNLGATMPSYIPREIRRIDGWWPQFTPQFGYTLTYKTSDKWALGIGAILDYKGMGVKEKVKDLYTQVQLEENGDFMKGYFTGKNETRIKSAYVTVPLYIQYRINEKWQVRTGGYASYKFSSSFKGDVWGGHLRVGDPTGQYVKIDNKGEATFDFGDDIRDFDFGILVGASMKLNDKFNLYGNLNWGLTPIFHSNFNVMPFKMRNVYLALGVAYNL